MRDDPIVERAAISIVALCAMAVVAHADPGDRAAQLFDEGRLLLAKGDYAAACPRFSASLELRAAVGTKMNLADCEEHFGHYAAAWHLFREVVADGGGNPERTKLARDRAVALTPHLATIHLAVREPKRGGLVIRIAGRTVPAAAEVRDRVDPGRVDVVATAPDWKGFASTTTAVAGETVELAIDEQAPAPDVVTELPLAETAGDRRSGWVHGAIALGGLSLGAAVTGLVVALVARSDYRGAIDRGECTMVIVLACTAAGKADVDHAGTLADVGTGLAITAGLLGAAALVTWYVAPRERVVIAPIAGRATAGLAAAWSF